MVQEQVSDLKYLLDHLPCPKFHLLGHSFGGILVYEYLKLVAAAAEAEIEPEASGPNSMEKEEASAEAVDSSLDTAHASANSTSTSTTKRESARKRMIPKKECCSVILASTPVSIATCQADCNRLLADIGRELVLEQENHGDGSDNDIDDDGDCNAEDERYMRQQHQQQQLDLQQLQQQHQQPSKQAQDIFWQRHECRVTPMPYALVQALQQSSVQSTAGHGLIRLVQHEPQQDANNNTDKGNGGGLRDYVATAPTLVTNNDGSRSALMPPALVLRGQYDFVLASNSLDVWGDLLLNGDDGNGNTEYITLAGTSHYAMVEQEDLFGSVLQVFFQQHDPAGLEAPAFIRPGVIAPRHHSSHQQRKHKHKHQHQYLDSSASSSARHGTAIDER